MPHKCTRCGEVYEDGSENILRGCKCGNGYFLYFRKITDAEAKELKIKKKVREAGEDEKKIWNVKVEDGTYDIDVGSLMMQDPVIISGEEGRYLLSLSSAFKSKKKQKYVDTVKK
ncbi:MAG: Zn-ribbon containing protein [Candidatus Hydrothermarchaeaceae archaeon]